MTRPTYIRAAGMATPVGLTWQTSCAAMRAGLTRKSISPYHDDDGREIVASYLLTPLREEASADERWIALLTYALRDIARQVDHLELEQTPLFLARPLLLHGLSCSIPLLSEALSNALDLRIAPENLHVFNEGSYGGYVALERGRALVRTGQPCIVAAAESMLCARTLLRLSDQQRLLVEGNSDGIIPGEAAAAMLLSPDRMQALATLRGLGFGKESAALDNDLPLRADGLITAARGALREANLQLHELDFRVSDASGESFYFKEQSLLVSRLLRERRAEFPLWLSAEPLGDTGAAGGLCGLLWAMASWARKYAPGPRAIGFAGNDEGARAAVVLERGG
ncbi:3-oxoacyl-(acyl carrier protein) synthase [Myxococcus stipitatus DSM 14675]|uniref:3-oxoacyl-(Acyl carrier protein) synthase n=1 Tax=Myxococcus stipitatus (strain DSM 14675 / JCM 12634 / Mx s8) TaxID=1278073 RepID=L7U7I5_MYXSD|nr:3-oxoacyl-(acyl carrier protein) synthase [Myxococcus stipitatus]AGC44063.1 3-oxoacyl-(acyl carrier protein) synthase [Myxococcus stipitatus DSM 14675]